MKMQLTAKELASALGGCVDGDPAATVTSFAKIEHGNPGQLCFYANPKYEKYVYGNKATIILVNNDFEPREPVSATLVRVPDAYKALADLLKYASEKRRKSRCHRGRCRIAWSAKLGRKVWVGDFVTIGRKCRIGDNTRIYNNVTIGEGTVIGSDCIIYPGVHIFPGMKIGDRVILHAGCIIGDDGFGNSRQPDGSWEKIEHMGDVIIGNDVEIGSNTTVDKAPMESTIIADGVRIDNLCQIAHNVVVGKNTAIAAQTGIAGSAVIGENCLLGGQVGIAGHLKVADGTTVCAKSAIIGTVRESGQTFFGVPAIKHSVFMRAYAKFKRSGME
ncbi:MAG: UDP-3-O-(3-hydroxymyristoyl)glucosamine N-acyltransferase [Bacteroidales bacterium]|nr:UDP-3-O-(3-hydroxymyristoyl)glucosamine N-acyltransferase [Bacteroidales bacterium]